MVRPDRLHVPALGPNRICSVWLNPINPPLTLLCTANVNGPSVTSRNEPKRAKLAYCVQADNDVGLT